MSDLLAIDVALLPPGDVSDAAVRLSAGLPAAEPEGLRLDAAHLPHITLSQHFVRANELDEVLAHVDAAVRDQPALTLSIIGGGHGAHSVWMAVEPTPPLVDLHQRIMDGLRGLERSGGGGHAFFGGDARVADVAWVTSYRLKSSFAAFTPHITLGAGAEPPAVEPLVFIADTVAVCHLGKFCACRHVFRRWTLGHRPVTDARV